MLNLSDGEQIVRDGTDIASCKVIDGLTVVKKTESGTHEAGRELPELVKELYERSSEGLDDSQKDSCIRCWWNLKMYFQTVRVT